VEAGRIELPSENIPHQSVYRHRPGIYLTQAFAPGQGESAPVHRKSHGLLRQTQTAASPIALHLSGTSGVSRFSVIVERSIAHAARQRKRSRNRCWQLLCCRFLRGQRRLGLQPWLPIPVETSAPPFGIYFGNYMSCLKKSKWQATLCAVKM